VGPGVCSAVPRITTKPADTVVPALVPEAVTQPPTQTLANDTEPLLCSVNMVVPVTSAVQLVPLFEPPVKLPVAPLLPQKPAVLSPLTDSTLPEPCGGENQTLAAVTVVPAVVPAARAPSPTQRSAK